MFPLVNDAERSRVLHELQTLGPQATGINQFATRLGLSFGLVKSTLEDLAAMGLINLENVNGRYRILTSSALSAEIDRAKERVYRPEIRVPTEDFATISDPRKG
jgi:DNA-binding IclR family transcriptional regulator